MNIEELDIDGLSAEVDKYVTTFKVFKNGQEVLDKLKALKQLKGDIQGDIDALKEKLASLKLQEDSANAEIDAAVTEAEGIISKAEKDAEAKLESAKAQASDLLKAADAEIAAKNETATHDLADILDKIEQTNAVLNKTRADLDDLRKQRDDVAGSISSLKEQKQKLLEAFK